MAVGDDMTESVGLNSVEFGQFGSTLSPEDVAWADSCLTKDPVPEISDSDWSSLKDALLETLSAQSESSARENDDVPEGAKMEICSSDEDINDTKISIETDNSDSNAASTTSTEDAKPDDDDPLSHESTDDFWTKHNIEDVFLPTYKESLRDIGNPDPELDIVFQTIQSDESTEDIFKIWDLGIPVPEEDDDLIKQLNKSLSEGSPETKASVSGDDTAWKGLKDESLDDIISGIADLSLSPSSA